MKRSFVMDGRVGNYSNSMRTYKSMFLKAYILLLHQIGGVGINYSFFSRVALVGVFVKWSVE
jgi:hypothetical protein